MTALRAAALGISLAFAFTVAAIAVGTPGAMDFVSQYAAARLVWLGHGPAILDPAAVLAAERAAAPGREVLLPFVQPPAVALLLAPLAALPFEAAFAVVAAVDAVMIAIALALLRPRTGPALSWTVALLLFAPPSAIAVAHAQTTPLVLLLVALSGRLGPRASGAALGLTLIRPQAAPLLLLAALADPRRRWAALLGAIAIVMASLAVVGIDGVSRYAAALVGAAGWSITGEHGLRTSIGWAGLALWLGVGPLGPILVLASLAAGAFAVVRAADEDRVRVAATWSLLGSPHALVHDALLAYPAVLALTSRRAAWDVASVLAWAAHVIVAPLGVLWSLVVAARTGYARRVR